MRHWDKNKKKQHHIGRDFFEDFSALTKIAINFHARGNELFTPHPAQAKARKLRARHVSNKVKYLLSRDDTNSDSFLKLFTIRKIWIDSYALKVQKR